MTIEVMQRDDMVYLDYEEAELRQFSGYKLLFRHPAAGGFYAKQGSVPDRYQMSVIKFFELFKAEDAKQNVEVSEMNIDTDTLALRFQPSTTPQTPAPSIYLGPHQSFEYS